VRSGLARRRADGGGSKCRRNLCCEQLDGSRDFGEGQSAKVDLGQDALAPQNLCCQRLLDDLVWTPHVERAIGGGEPLVCRTVDLEPAA
jgi:hypothetical protein